MMKKGNLTRCDKAAQTVGMIALCSIAVISASVSCKRPLLYILFYMIKGEKSSAFWKNQKIRSFP